MRSDVIFLCQECQNGPVSFSWLKWPRAERETGWALLLKTTSLVLHLKTVTRADWKRICPRRSQGQQHRTFSDWDDWDEFKRARWFWVQVASARQVLLSILSLYFNWFYTDSRSRKTSSTTCSDGRNDTSVGHRALTTRCAAFNNRSLRGYVPDRCCVLWTLGK